VGTPVKGLAEEARLAIGPSLRVSLGYQTATTTAAAVTVNAGGLEKHISVSKTGPGQHEA
jgi:hypothetical protein